MQHRNIFVPAVLACLLGGCGVPDGHVGGVGTNGTTGSSSPTPSSEPQPLLQTDRAGGENAERTITHVLKDGSTRTFVVRDTKTPEGVAPTQVFYEPNGDIVIGRIDELPDYLAQQEARNAASGEYDGP